MGLYGQKITYNEDFTVIAKQCKEVLEESLGGEFPIDRIFNCQNLLPGMDWPDHLDCPTGYNNVIFTSIWVAPGITELAMKVFQSYTKHDRTCKYGEDYRAAFVCKTGDERSVAVAIGLQSVFATDFGIDCTVTHLNDENKKWSRMCHGRCDLCSSTDAESQSEVVRLALLGSKFVK